MCFSANLVSVKYTICRMPLCFYDEILLRAKITTKTEYSDVTSKNVTNIDEKMSIPLNQVLLDFQLGKYSDLKKKSHKNAHSHRYLQEVVPAVGDKPLLN